MPVGLASLYESILNEAVKRLPSSMLSRYQLGKKNFGTKT